MHTPSCPRCGYDVSGVIGTWTDRCPLRGICSECGFDFQWVDVLRPELLRLGGFAEHAGSPGQAIRWGVRTWLWALRPWVFWRRVELRHAPRVPAMGLWLALSFAPGLALTWLVGVLLWMTYASPGQRADPAALLSPWLELVTPWLDRRWLWWNRWGKPFWHAVTLPLLMCSCFWPLLLWVLGTTRARARVRIEHVVRAGVFGLSWLVPVLLVRVADYLFGLATLTADLLLPGSGMTPRRGSVSDWMAPYWRVWLLLGFVWIQAWWLCAIRYGFGLPRSWVVWSVLSIPVTLALLLTVILVHLQLLWA